MVGVKGGQAPEEILPSFSIPVFRVVRQGNMFLEAFHGSGTMLDLVSNVFRFSDVTKVWGPPEVD